jgi:uridylate kinase
MLNCRLMKNTTVISVGGSLIVPDAIDTTFLTNLKNLITEHTASGDVRFIIIAGGGRTARRYQDAAAAVSTLTRDDLDWMGIHATRLNGHLLRTVFRDIAYRVMITNPDDIHDVPAHEKLIIAAGYRPGASTDLRAVQIAERVGAQAVVNLTNTSHVYTANPKTDPTATPVETITWPEFMKLIPAEWDPGLSSPFDPVAARAAAALGLTVAHIDGTRLSELNHFLNGESFTGTTIHP